MTKKSPKSRPGSSLNASSMSSVRTRPRRVCHWNLWKKKDLEFDFEMYHVTVASKRGSLNTTYASDTQAKKLWGLLMKHKAAKTPSFTYGALDTVQVIQMGKYLDTIYVSGWQSSSTASTSNEPGPDLADYPMVRFSELLLFICICKYLSKTQTTHTFANHKRTRSPTK